MADDPLWPKRPDGSPMMFGECSAEQQRAILRRACAHVQRELNDPLVQEKIAHILNGGKLQ